MVSGGQRLGILVDLSSPSHNPVNAAKVSKRSINVVARCLLASARLPPSFSNRIEEST